MLFYKLTVLRKEPLKYPMKQSYSSRQTAWSRLLGLQLLTQLVFLAPLGAAEPPAGEALFAHRILPLFKSKCFACHGDDPKDVRGDLDMRTRAGLLRGGESGEASLTPGKPAESPLYDAIRWDGLEMPPKENDRLTDRQVQLVGEWISAGAPWPDEARRKELLANTEDQWSTPGGVEVATSGGLSPQWTHRKYDPTNLWAYASLPEPFEPTNFSEVIDQLLAKKLDSLNLRPAPLADRRTLIRRATFDLIGLPPTPAEIANFVDDPAGDDAAFAKVVDRLLASPHYGEHWGRHWLDVVRYADSSGFANDYERGVTWRYRDYVIRAFNEDKPYDQFIVEQIAGDELEGTPEQLIAVGFLRMGPWELTGMEVAKIARQRFLDDVTDAVGQVFLGHMLQCARCHDHKFDPIPTRDYYAMQAVFATTQFAHRPAPHLEQENTAGFEEQRYLEQRQQHYQAELAKLNKKRNIAAGLKWLEENHRDTKPMQDTIAALKAAKRPVNLNAVRSRMQADKVNPELIPPRHAGFEPRDFGLERICRKGLERLKWRMTRYKPLAFSVYSGHTQSMSRVNAPLTMPKDVERGELEQTAILTGGDPFAAAEPVAPAPLSVVNDDAAFPKSVAGRRLALARWIASANNPLTARVMANRIWQWHFGQALAGNPNNFGATGKKPTHPELLDQLAAEFIASGWSMKSLHRVIMNSAAYRRDSSHPQAATLMERDPNGESFAAFQARRLTAEELRDAMLSAAGMLNPVVGGIPVRPEMNLEAALQPRQVMGTFAEAWQPSPKPSQRHRRSVYAQRIRGQRDPFFEVFNSPAADISCEARDSSTVTPQVFAMFNSEISLDRALAFADRLLKENRGPRETLSRMFEFAYGRPADDSELLVTLEHWKKMEQRHETLQFARPKYPREVVRNAVEENTGEPFQFVEPLEVYADFEPDLKLADASPRLRGLAEVCLVIMNSNEFAYVY